MFSVELFLTQCDLGNIVHFNIKMSNSFGSWPEYRLAPFRGIKTLTYKVIRFSWRFDRVGAPLMIFPVALAYYLSEYGHPF